MYSKYCIYNLYLYTLGVRALADPLYREAETQARRKKRADTMALIRRPIGLYLIFKTNHYGGSDFSRPLLLP